MDYTAKIAKKDLQHGVYYKGTCRNTEVARWNADKQVFVHWRTKWGTRFLETIKHPEDDAVYDVFVVECECNPLEEIPFTD